MLHHLPLRVAFCLLFSFTAVTTVWAQVSGYVRDSVSGTGIADALVTLQATDVRTTTAPDGSFTLPGLDGVDLVIVGAKKGYYNVSTLVSTPEASAEILLDVLPIANNPDFAFRDPNSCAMCHPDQVQQWTDSPMSKAGTNTWVYDIYDGTGTPGGMGGFVYTRDSRFADHNPGSECASCHQPEPWVKQPFKPMDDINDLSAGAMHGVSCQVCHQIAHVDESKVNFPGLIPGAVDFSFPEDEHTIQFGILGDSDYSLVPVMRASYQPQLNSAMCAVCHQDKNDPDEDGDFEEENGVISEPTYLEWLDSPYGDPESPLYQDCVSCHMPSYGATQVCNILNPPLLRDPETIRGHTIEGTTAEYLENAVELELSCEIVANTLQVQVNVDNSLTGHHVPTGVTIRNAILLVEAWREDDSLPLESTGNQVVHELGGVGDPELGYYAGEPGKFFAKVNIDETSGTSPTFFTDATAIVFDSRIPALTNDVTDYSFTIPEGDGTYRVRARMIYRRSFRFLTEAKNWIEDGHGNPLEDVAPPYYGHLMEEVEWSSDATGIDSSRDRNRDRSVVARLLAPRPNPVTTSAGVRFALAEPGAARVGIYDLSGRLVRSLTTKSEYSAGLHEIEWDGAGENGRMLSNGIYFIGLEMGGVSDRERIVLLR